MERVIGERDIVFTGRRGREAFMEMRIGSVLFPSLRGGGPRTATQAIDFPRQVERAVAGITGYSAGFSGEDHHLGHLEVRLDTSITGDNVRVDATFGLRDWSGFWDDNYEGNIQFVVLADLEPLPQPDPNDPQTQPRLDLTITGVEVTQATQYFRSDRFLDPPNVRPDNSVRLVARKTTGLRVYVDYDATAGLPPISSLSGLVQVSTSIGSTTFSLSPAETITPRRDNAIDRAQANHTLNFAIPEGWCQGELTVRCWAFDKDAPNWKSPAFQRTIRFDDVTPLRMYGVGVHYTGQNKDLAAPSQTDFMNTMSFVERTYPTGEVSLTGYSVIDFSRDMKADIEDGCGDGFNALLDELRDMRGDSQDVYYGLLPSGIDSGSVGGCGGGGVGAGFIGGGATAAQEIGHAFGRDHAPCDNENRCGNPADEDGGYPVYNGFPSDSIGEFGYDPSANTVFNPVMTFDFMGYSGPVWVSPYTYQGLRSRFPPTSGASSMRMLRSLSGRTPDRREARAEWRRVKMMTLFLGLEIDVDRTVRVRPSFHYPAFPGRPGRRLSGFVVEILDEHGDVIACRELREGCYHCRPNCWPKSFREMVPFPEGASRLVVREGRERLHEQPIPDPPDIKLEHSYDDRDNAVVLKWSGRGRENEGQKEGDRELWYLVQLEDRDGTWRGLAPRTRDASARVPARLFGGRSEMRVRVLATSGIATGVAEATVRLPEAVPPRGEVVVVEPPKGLEPRSPIVDVVVLDGTGRTVEDPEVIWYDADGREVARGRSLDVRTLPPGQHIVRAVALGAPSRALDTSVLVERLEGNVVMVHSGLSPQDERKRDRHTHDDEPTRPYPDKEGSE